MSANNRNVLFLCTGNSARSQMAEGLLRHYAGDRFVVYSAGIEAKGVNPYAIRAMDEIGVDIRGQRSKTTEEFIGKTHFGYVITVCGHADQNCPTALWERQGKKLHWPFEDPAAVTGSDEEKIAAFRLVRDALADTIKRWLMEF